MPFSSFPCRNGRSEHLEGDLKISRHSLGKMPSGGTVVEQETCVCVYMLEIVILAGKSDRDWIEKCYLMSYNNNSDNDK